MKKFFVILLSTLLLIGLLPISAFADLSAEDLSKLIDMTSIASHESGDAKISISYSLADTESILAGETNELTILVTNNGNAISDAALTLATPTGIVIQSGSVKRNIGVILPGETAEVSFPITCTKGITENSYPFSVSFSGSVANYPDTVDLLKLFLDWAKPVITVIDEQNFRWDMLTEAQFTSVAEFLATFANTPVSSSDTFYVPLTVLEGATSYTTPRLMLTNYNCGGTVLAGSDFGLELTFKNTSKEDLYNIKVTVGTNEFVPVGSSNSFFIESVKAGESVSKTVVLSVPRTALQGQHSIDIASTYENAKGTTYNGSDVISVPVMQETRLVVDDILDPGWLTMSDTGYATVNFRNMGNNTVSNLTIKVTGDFSMEGTNVYYVGNLAAGKSDNYSFSFYPFAEGNCHGTVTFTYEDAEAYEHHVDKEFNFNIGPAYSYDDPGEFEPMPEVQTGLPKWAKIAIPVAALVVIIIVILAIKKHKAKKQEALDLE